MVGAAEFAVVIAVLYFLECFITVLPTDVVFDRRISFAYGILKPSQLGWLLLNPLMPSGSTFRSQTHSFFLTPTGICLCDESNSPWRHVDYEECDSPCAENEIVILNATDRIALHSSIEARQVAKAVSEMAGLRVDKRMARIQNHLQEQFDLTALNSLLESFDKRSRWLQSFVQTQCIVVLLLFPAMAALVGLRMVIYPTILVVLTLAICIAISYERVHRHYFDGDAVEKWSTISKIVLYPISSLRCIDTLSLRLLSNFDPVAIATVLCGKDVAMPLAAKRLARLRVASPIASDGFDGPYESRAIAEAALISFLHRSKMDVSHLMRPQTRDKACLSYCPMCLVQYTMNHGLCVDCGGVPLQRFDQTVDEVGEGV